MSKNLMMLSTTPWQSPYWFRRQYFAKHLADRGWRVLYCDPRHTVIHAIRKSGLGSLRLSLLRDTEIARECEDRLLAIRLRHAPPLYYRGGPMSTWGRRLLAPALHAQAKRHFGSEKYVQVIYSPLDLHILRLDLPIVYEVVDKWTAYPGLKCIRRIERYDVELRREAQAVIGTTADLIGDVPDGRRHVIPNGVDTKVFDAGKHYSEPACLAAIPHPRIIYAGALWEWFDYELLNGIASHLPSANIVLLGFSNRPLPELPSNIHYLGAKLQSELPSYYAHSDVGIIPFRDIELTKYVNPLKFYEYMAMGLPCVSVPMDPLMRYEQEGILALQRGTEDFAASVASMIDVRHCRIEARRSIALRSDWESLSHEFEFVAAAALDQQ